MIFLCYFFIAWRWPRVYPPQWWPPAAWARGTMRSRPCWSAWPRERSAGRRGWRRRWTDRRSRRAAKPPATVWRRAAEACAAARATSQRRSTTARRRWKRRRRKRRSSLEGGAGGGKASEVLFERTGVFLSLLWFVRPQEHALFIAFQLYSPVGTWWGNI